MASKVRIRGHLVSDPWLIAKKEFYSHNVYKGRQVIHYVFCESTNCKKFLTARSYKKTGRRWCLQCSNKLKAKPVSSHILTQLRRHAKSVGRECLLTQAQIAQLLAINRCTYCSKILRQTYTLDSESKKGKQFPYQLDRLDSAKGYSADNVVPCCRGCNSIKKNRISAKEMLAVAQVKKGHCEAAAAVMRATSFTSALAILPPRKQPFGKLLLRFLSLYQCML